MKPFSDNSIIRSWRKNVQPWVSAIRKGEIDSRVQVTNQTIVDSILNLAPETVLDIGCGEGWLVREVAKVGIDVLGVDAVPELIEYARKKGGGRFDVIAYENLSADVLKEKFDLAVCNFSLLGHESVTQLFQKIPFLLNHKGIFIIQTLHPVAGCGEGKYEDGWREGSWAGFSHAFQDPAPWYFRKIGRAHV